MAKITYTLNGHTFRRMKELTVYTWRRGDVYLYIGLTGSGIGRVFSHNVVDRAELVESEDVIEFRQLPGMDWQQAAAVEARLIRKHQPRYNVVNMQERECDLVQCITCKAGFFQKRWWQRFCSPACRTGKVRY